MRYSTIGLSNSGSLPKYSNTGGNTSVAFQYSTSQQPVIPTAGRSSSTVYYSISPNTYSILFSHFLNFGSESYADTMVLVAYDTAKSLNVDPIKLVKEIGLDSDAALVALSLISTATLKNSRIEPNKNNSLSRIQRQIMP